MNARAVLLGESHDALGRHSLLHRGRVKINPPATVVTQILLRPEAYWRAIALSCRPSAGDFSGRRLCGRAARAPSVEGRGFGGTGISERQKGKSSNSRARCIFPDADDEGQRRDSLGDENFSPVHFCQAEYKEAG